MASTARIYRDDEDPRTPQLPPPQLAETPRRTSDRPLIGFSTVSNSIYWLIHAACLLAFYTGVSGSDIALCLGIFGLRMFAITGGYHRFFAHRAFKTSRAFQFVLAFLGCTATQKGPLWWCGWHRHHHANSDTEKDLHSPQFGFWYSHQGWILDSAWHQTPTELIRDFARYPELEWLNRYHFVPPLLLGLALFAFGGLSAFVWGYCISTTLLWHSTYTINSLAHVWGSRRYDTGDTSRNNFVLALLTFGEGWHNNHHHYMASARQGFFWWEVDLTYYLLRGLQALGVVWDLREPPERVIADQLKRAGET